MVVGLEAMGGVFGCGSAAWASDLVLPLPLALLFWESICCCCWSSSVEGDLVRSHGETCASSWSSTMLKRPVMDLANLPWTCGADGRESRCPEMNLQAGANVARVQAEEAGDTSLVLQIMLAVRFRAELQCVPVGTSLLPSMLARSSIPCHGWAAQGHTADVHKLGFERLVAGEFYPTHEGGMQYLCCTVLSFFCSECYCKLSALAVIPICWRSLGAAGSYIWMLAGREFGLLIRSHFVLTLMLLPIYGQWRPHALWMVTSNPSIIPPGRYTLRLLQAGVQAVYDIFLPLGLIRLGRVRASRMSVLRFSGEDPPVLSSVLRHLDLQLNPQPQIHLPTRLPVEPLVLRLVRWKEALEECDCRLFVSEFSPDLLAGSSCILPLSQLSCSSASLLCVRLGNSPLDYVYQSMNLSVSWVVISLEY